MEAIRLASEDGNNATEVERRLGIDQGMISRWKRQVRQKREEAFSGTGHWSTSEAQLRDLQRENDRLRREREILTKALAIFSEGR